MPKLRGIAPQGRQSATRTKHQKGTRHMETILRTLKVRKARPALFMMAGLATATLVASTPADARIGFGRPGIGVGRVGSGLGFRPGLGVGRAGLGWGGWRGGVGWGGGGWGRGWGWGGAALAGAAISYGLANTYDDYS